MQTMAIRRLGAGDEAMLVRLNALFAVAFEDPDLLGDGPPDPAYLAGLLGLPHMHVLVAMDNATLLGGLVAYELPKIERSRSEFYLYDLAVAEPYRRRGVARALIERLREMARRSGAADLYVQADFGDDPAVALYSRFGAPQPVMHFDLELEDDAKV